MPEGDPIARLCRPRPTSNRFRPMRPIILDRRPQQSSNFNGGIAEMRLEPANETQMRQGIFLWFFGSKGHMDVVSMIKNEIRREILVLEP